MGAPSAELAESGALTADLRQTSYRVYADDAGMNAATPLAAKDAAAYVARGGMARVRIAVENWSGTASLRYVLCYRVNGGTWDVVDNTNASPIAAQPKISASSQFADGAATAELLSAQTFVVGEGIEANRNSAQINLAASPRATELEWSLLFDNLGLRPGDIVQLKVDAMTTAWSGGPASAAVLNSYAVFATVIIAAQAAGGTTLPERSVAYEGAQIGVEVTPGTPVAATKRLLCTDIDFDVAANIKTYRPGGVKFATGAGKGKEYSQVKLSGWLCYTDIVYLLCNCLVSVAPTTPTNNGVWTVGVGAASAGNFTLTYGGQTTAGIAFNASAAAVKSALELLSTVGTGLVSVTGAAPTWTVTFLGPLSTGGALTGSGAGLTGGAFTCTSTAAVNTRRWTFLPSFFQPDTVKTLTLEKGVSGVASLANQIARIFMSDIGLKLNKDEATISGQGFGDKAVDPFTYTTGGVTDLAALPADPANVSCWLGDALAGTGAAQLMTRMLDVEWNVAGRFSPLITLNAADPSVSAGIEANGAYSVRVTMEHDAQGQTVLAKLRAGTTQYVCMEVTGPTIETGYPNRFKLTAPLLLTDPNRNAVDNAVCLGFNAECAYVPAFGGGLKVEVDNNLASL